MQLSDFNFDLPNQLIARYPLAERSASRLLCLQNGSIIHKSFKDIIHLIQPNDLLVCNNSKVIPARLWGQKETGGRVEILVERLLPNPKYFLAHVRVSKTPKPGNKIILKNNIVVEMIGRKDNLFQLFCDAKSSFLEVLEEIGEIPLPPYFERAPEEMDKERYQTLYALHQGSVAAPTAGLHFDNELLQAIKNKGVSIGYVTLHVGAGTFAPVRVKNILEHKMHAEYLEVSQALCDQIKKTRENGGRVIAVGTTSVRAIESAAKLSNDLITPYYGDTDIFIYPGFKFKCVDALITNFHLPGSTLLMLVSAFAGHDTVMNAYKEAVKEKYRFFSYGDAMYLYT